MKVGNQELFDFFNFSKSVLIPTFSAKNKKGLEEPPLLKPLYILHSYNEKSIKVQENILTDKNQPKYINPEKHWRQLEVRKMKDLKGWPFEPLDDGVQPCGGGGPGAGGVPG